MCRRVDEGLSVRDGDGQLDAWLRSGPQVVGLNLDCFFCGETSKHKLAARDVLVVWRQFQAYTGHKVAVPVESCEHVGDGLPETVCDEVTRESWMQVSCRFEPFFG